MLICTFWVMRVSPGNPSKQAIIAQYFSNCTVKNFNMLTEACSMRCSSWVSWNFSEHCTERLTLECMYLERIYRGKTGNCLEGFPLVNNLSHCRMMDLKLPGNSLINHLMMMGSNSCFSKTIAAVVPPWRDGNTHQDAPDQHTAKTSAFIEMVTLEDDQLIGCIWLAGPGCSLLC